jgi:hypothetical protein
MRYVVGFFLVLTIYAIISHRMDNPHHAPPASTHSVTSATVKPEPVG